MSFTCHVLYQNVSKKIQCPNTHTVNQLIELSLAKFNLSLSFGELSSGGKKLDALLPIRYTNLVNNAKLTLTVSKGNTEVNLKIVGTIELKQITSMMKVPPSITAAELVLQFATLNNIEIDLASKHVLLSVLQTAVDNISHEFDKTTLKSLLGTSSSAMIRLVVEDKSKHAAKKKLQEEQGKLRAQLEEKKRQARLLEKEQNDAKEPEPTGHKTVTTEPVLKPKSDQIDHPEEKSLPSEGPSNSLSNTIVPDETNSANKKGEDLMQTDPVKTTPGASDGNSERNARSFVLSNDTEDTVYVPHKKLEVYENPEDDYNMTTAQAETYLNIIKSMQTRPKKKNEAKSPTHYAIRLRFPDRSLVQLHIEDPSTKLGQLMKKIDSYIDPKFINSYRIKNGTPPFKEIKFGFQENGTALNEHLDFQQEKVLLIWEPSSSHQPGPYLVQGVNTKDVSQLSTVMLETHRGELEEDALATGKSVKGTSDEKPKLKTKLNKSMPKWFRP